MLSLLFWLSMTGPELEELYRTKQFFALRDRLEASSPANDAETLLLRAAVAQAFNELASAERYVESALAVGDAADATRLKLLRLRRDTAMRRYHYREGHDAARAVLTLPGSLSTKEERKDDENMRRLLAALEDVRPQRVIAEEDSRVVMSRNSLGGLRVPLRVDGHERAYLFDTGANLSVVMRSEAAALGLTVRSAGIDVGSSTGAEIRADLAVADELVLGNHRLTNVVFLVFPDELLTIPEADLRLEGIIGFPVFEAIGEIRFGRDGTLTSPAVTPTRSVSNLALNLLEPLTKVEYEGDAFVCRLDSGANATDFYEPFYRTHREGVERLGTLRSVSKAGVGSKREVRAYAMPELELGVGGRTVTLENVPVFTERLGKDGENFLDCNLGQDVLGRFDAYIINFRSMTFLLE